MYVCIYIYIYIQREKYIYIYICIYIYTVQQRDSSFSCARRTYIPTRAICRTYTSTRLCNVALDCPTEALELLLRVAGK